MKKVKKGRSGILIVKRENVCLCASLLPSLLMWAVWDGPVCRIWVASAFDVVPGKRRQRFLHPDN